MLTTSCICFCRILPYPYLTPLSSIVLQPVDDDEDDAEDFTFTSPVDNLDVTKHFLATMSEVAGRDPALAHALQSSLSEDDSKRLALLVAKVVERDLASEGGGASGAASASSNSNSNKGNNSGNFLRFSR